MVNQRQKNMQLNEKHWFILLVIMGIALLLALIALTIMGVEGTFMDVSSHGEANPIVKTADNVSNAKNRRVEVVVR